MRENEKAYNLLVFSNKTKNEKLTYHTNFIKDGKRESGEDSTWRKKGNKIVFYVTCGESLIIFFRRKKRIKVIIAR